jgi:hypothetical protein
VVVAPLFYEPGKGLTLDRVRGIKTGVTKFYDESKFRTQEDRAAAFEKLKTMQSSVDPKLAEAGISKALKMGGLSSIAGAAGTLAGQALSKGQLNFKEAADKTPKSLENLMARFAMNFLVDQTQAVPDDVPADVPAGVSDGAPVVSG